MGHKGHFIFRLLVLATIHLFINIAVSTLNYIRPTEPWEDWKDSRVSLKKQHQPAGCNTYWLSPH